MSAGSAESPRQPGRIRRLIAKLFRRSRGSGDVEVLSADEAQAQRKKNAEALAGKQPPHVENELIVGAILGAMKNVTFGEAVKHAKHSAPPRRMLPRMPERRALPEIERIKVQLPAHSNLKQEVAQEAFPETSLETAEKVSNVTSSGPLQVELMEMEE